MTWVDVKEDRPEQRKRVLVAMNARSERPIIAVGDFRGDHWIVDDYTRPVGINEVQFWAPIAPIPRGR